MLFVDTSGWFAFFMPLDANHQRVKAYLERPAEPLITTDYCIDETLTLLLARGETHRALRACRGFFHENMAQIHFVTPQQIHRAWILFQQRAIAGWSFTDCTSKVVIDELGIQVAAALDDHFRQFGNILVLPLHTSAGSSDTLGALASSNWFNGQT